MNESGKAKTEWTESLELFQKRTWFYHSELMDWIEKIEVVSDLVLSKIVSLLPPQGLNEIALDDFESAKEPALWSVAVLKNQIDEMRSVMSKYDKDSGFEVFQERNARNKKHGIARHG